MSTTSTATASTITTASAGATTHSPASTGPSALTSTQFASFLAAIKSSEEHLDLKLTAVKADVKQAQDDAATKAVSHIRNVNPTSIRRRGTRSKHSSTHRSRMPYRMQSCPMSPHLRLWSERNRLLREVGGSSLSGKNPSRLLTTLSMVGVLSQSTQPTSLPTTVMTSVD